MKSPKFSVLVLGLIAIYFILYRYVDIGKFDNKIYDLSLSAVKKIDDKKYLVGVNLWGGTQSFYLHTGVQNSLLLPYPVMIENGKAKMLDPKYYIALSYPMLKMSQFMKISAIPAQIEKQCRSVFK